MTNRGKKVGLITLSLPRERTDLAENFGKKAAKSLRLAGFEVIDDGNLIFETDNCINTAKKYENIGVDCVIILLGTWVFTPTVVDTLKEVDLPFGIWAEDNPASFSLTAGGIVHGSLDELGIKHRFFYGSPHSERLIKETSAFIRAAAADRDLKGKRLCVVGGRVMGMYTTMVDIIQIKNIFGIEVEHIDSFRVYLEAKSAPDSEVSRVRKWIGDTFGKINADEKILERSIRLYVALKDILVKDGYDVVAVKCQDEMINNYASSCLAISLLNDDGITVSCESDINAALTMRILRSISGEISLFGDVNHIDQQEKILRIVNCGSMPTLMAESRREVDIEVQYEYMGKARGATTVFCVRESPVTFARLSRINGRYVLFAAEGNTKQVEKKRFKEAREYWPHAFVKLDCDMNIFHQNIRSNHIHLCFGNYLTDLKEFCRLKDIDFICPL